MGKPGAERANHQIKGKVLINRGLHNLKGGSERRSLISLSPSNLSPLLLLQIIDSPEILQVIDSLPHLRQLSTSLYDSQYALFFKSLASVETTHLLPSRILGQHSRHYVKELRIIAYKQLLESYRSVTLENFAKAFGVSKEWIDGELAGFIGEGRLDARVDKVSSLNVWD